MNKSTKNKIIVLFVILILFSSSIAFVVLNATDFSQQQETITELNSPIIKGEITQETEYAYLKAGFTFFKYYYINGTDIPYYLESLVETFRTSDGTYQLFVQEIDSDSSKMTISTLYGNTDIENMTYVNVFDSLCETVTIKPPECIIGKLLFNETV